MTEKTQEELIEATIPKPIITCVIPARGGSKRIKHKNKRLMNGRPLVDYALKAAIDSELFSLIIVSSDDKDILAHTYGYFNTQIVQPHKRPNTLCGDNIPLKVVVRYCLQAYQTHEDTCLIQPTNPLITAEQIKDAYMRFNNDRLNYLVGMCNGKDIGFHFFKKSSFLAEYDKDFYGTGWVPFEMKGVDIDTEEDWIIAEKLLKEAK